MNSSPASPDKAPAPLVAEGGLPYRLSAAADPFAAWIDLMEAVEALCPTWPPREISVGGVYRL